MHRAYLRLGCGCIKNTVLNRITRKPDGTRHVTGCRHYRRTRHTTICCIYGERLYGDNANWKIFKRRARARYLWIFFQTGKLVTLFVFKKKTDEQFTKLKKIHHRWRRAVEPEHSYHFVLNCVALCSYRCVQILFMWMFILMPLFKVYLIVWKIDACDVKFYTSLQYITLCNIYLRYLAAQ